MFDTEQHFNIWGPALFISSLLPPPDGIAAIKLTIGYRAAYSPVLSVHVYLRSTTASHERNVPRKSASISPARTPPGVIPLLQLARLTNLTSTLARNCGIWLLTCWRTSGRQALLRVSALRWRLMAFLTFRRWLRGDGGPPAN